MADEGLDMIRSMVDFSADRLDRLRTQCATSAELTQQETRSLESKLVRLFCKLLFSCQNTSDVTTMEDLRQWLKVVGLTEQTTSAVIQHVNTLEVLLNMSDSEIRAILLTNNQEELRRLMGAINNLRRCQQCLKSGTEPSDMYWDSWDRRNNIRKSSHSEAIQSPVELSPPETQNSDKNLSLISPEDGSGNLSPSPSPPQSPSVNNTTSQSSTGSNHKRQKVHSNNINNNILKFRDRDRDKEVFSITNNLNNNDIEVEISVDLEIDPMLNKSKSNESQLSRQNGDIDVTLEGQPTPIIVSDISAPPRSPCTPVRGMHHVIQHRFIKRFRLTASTCDLCNKQMFFGFKCSDCKYRCHNDCKTNVPPSCGLPKGLVDEFKKTLHSEGLMPNASPNLPRAGLMPVKRNDPRHRPPMHSIPFHGADSSSAGSSCNSSSPSSPAFLTTIPQTPANKSQFNFPEVSSASVTIQNHQNSHHNSYLPNTIIEDTEMELQQQLNQDKIHSKGSENGVHLRNNNYQHSFTSLGSNDTSKLNGSIIDSSGTHHSNDSDKTMSTGESDRMTPRLESVEERDSSNLWPRQNSLSLKEWDIPFDDLKIGASIGQGRFGRVFRGHWYGDIAVKILNPNFLNDEHAIEAFKLEVATFKNTRHDNLVLFMGACMKPPNLAIVTSMCKGNTLYTHIHVRRDKFNLNKTTLIAQQIAQGMGYLHQRGIVHRDLKSKNIFLENEKVIITDFGLFSVTKLVYDCDKGLGIPSGWLCYLAPELIRNLKATIPKNEDLPFTKASDIYAFGAIWYELLCGEFPFKSQPSEAVIWQVGRGMKQSLANLQASRDVKDIFMLCWSFLADDRIDFGQLFQNLERLPKKRLARSPSHPIQLSRSAESVF